MKHYLIWILVLVLAGCTLVSVSTQVLIGDKDTLQETTQDSETLELVKE